MRASKDHDSWALHFTSSEKAEVIAFLKTLTDSKFLSDPRFSDPFK